MRVDVAAVPMMVVHDLKAISDPCVGAAHLVVYVGRAPFVVCARRWPIKAPQGASSTALHTLVEEEGSIRAYPPRKKASGWMLWLPSSAGCREKLRQKTVANISSLPLRQVPCQAVLFLSSCWHKHIKPTSLRSAWPAARMALVGTPNRFDTSR